MQTSFKELFEIELNGKARSGEFSYLPVGIDRGGVDLDILDI